MSDNHSKLDWQRLTLTDFGSPESGLRPKPLAPKPKPAKLEASRQDDQTKGFVQGYDDGLIAGRVEGFKSGEAAGLAEGQQAARQLLALAANLDKTLSSLDQEIADEILALSLEVARQVLRQTVEVRPEVVLSVVREALTQLPHQHAAIYLHPDDAELVRKYSGEQLSHAGHRIHEDTQLHRGDAVIEANGAQVDATLATRWRRVVETLGDKTPWVDPE